MAMTKRTTRRKSGSARKGTTAAAVTRKPAPKATTSGKRVAAPAASRPSTRKAAATPPAPVSPVTGQPTREKVHLPIKGYGRLNGFQVLENLYGKSVKDLQRILDYEQRHQARRMVIDRINDMVRRARG